MIVNTSQFKSLLSKYAKVDEPQASAFIDAFIATISDCVRSGEPVCISGLGTFRIIEAQQGQIKRMMFSPDEKIRESVNAPFACFEPYVITPAASDVVSPAVSVTADAAKSSTVAMSESVAQELSLMVDEINNAEAEEEIIPAVDKETPAEDKETPVAEEESPAEEVVTPVVEEESPATEEPAKVVPVAEGSPVESPAMGEIVPLAEDVNKETELSGKSFVWTVICSIAFLALVGSGVWFYLSYTSKPSFTRNTQQEVTTEVSNTVRRVGETVSPSAATAASADADGKPEQTAETQEQTAESIAQTAESIAQTAETHQETKHEEKPQKAQRPEMQQLLLDEDGKPRTFSLEPGERLTIIALNVYGDKAFWCYIYDVNSFQLSDPNNVPSNVMLYLPDPAYYRIDSDDQQSLRRARNRCAQILNNK